MKNYPNKANLKSNCPGGGRIKLEGNTILIYGYSKGFGLADHDKSKNIILS